MISKGSLDAREDVPFEQDEDSEENLTPLVSDQSELSREDSELSIRVIDPLWHGVLSGASQRDFVARDGLERDLDLIPVLQE